MIPTSKLDYPLAFSAKSNPDTMYFDEGMRQPDREQFLHAVVKEVNVWSLKRKGGIKTWEVYKWKARLNVYGGRQEKGINYWETFAPVVTWVTIKLWLILTIINK